MDAREPTATRLSEVIFEREPMVNPLRVSII